MIWFVLHRVIYHLYVFESALSCKLCTIVNTHNCSYNMHFCTFSVAINVRFDQSSYTVSEDDGSFSPELILSRPSPCCITVYIELIELPSSPTAAVGELSNTKYTMHLILQYRMRGYFSKNYR